jgi:hypothetical protein
MVWDAEGKKLERAMRGSLLERGAGRHQGKWASVKASKKIAALD